MAQFTVEMEELAQKRGIIPALVGGLGNQMWMVAASLVAAEGLGCPVYLPQNPISNNKHNHNQLDYNQSVFKEIGKHIDAPLQTVLSAAYGVGYRDVNWKGFHPWNPKAISEGSIFRSYCQYYPVLHPFADKLRHLFRVGLESYIETARRTYNPQRAAFLHVRRGDYLNYPDIHYSQPIAYYKYCVEALVEKVAPQQIWILSDDPEWVKQQPYFTGSPLFRICESKHELECIALMSLCTTGAICANSTFSWWGAFLGCGPNGNVLVPERWINDTLHGMFPDAWTVVSEGMYLEREKVRYANTCIVSLCDKGYFSKAKRTIEEARGAGKWKGDMVLIVVDWSPDEQEAAWLGAHGVSIHSVSHISTDALLQAYKEFPIHAPSDNRHIHKLYQWDKLHVFGAYFKKWKKIVFLDAGMRVFDSVEALLDIPCDGCILAPDDSDPYDNGNRFRCQLDVHANPGARDALFAEFSVAILEERYFLNCMFVFDTSRIGDGSNQVSFARFEEYMNKYPITQCNEMTIMNLVFTYGLRCWKPFPQKVGGKFLFAWSEKNYKGGLQWDKFHFVKYSATR
jgi:hypothetical protein